MNYRYTVQGHDQRKLVIVNAVVSVSNVLFFTLIGLMFIGLFWVASVQALEVSVQDPAGAPVSGFRWLLEEDTTHPVIVPTQNPPETAALVADSLSLDIHRSYAPIALDDIGAATGSTSGSQVTVNIPNNTRYALSVLPHAGYTIGGANIAVNQDVVTVTVTPLPLPTAQLSVFVFHDNNPINNVPDLPQEQGLAGFSVQVFDTADKVLTDTFGNPLGTTYDVDPAGVVTYNPDGTPAVISIGNGTVQTEMDGKAVVKYLAPGKYEVRIVPPTGQGWLQTSTLEGTPFSPAWILADEPEVFAASGFPPYTHVFYGFIQPFDNLPATATPGTISGRVVNAHNARPPDFTFSPGHPLPNCLVGLNDKASGTGIYVGACDPDSTFTITDIPPGDYELVVWDRFLDNLFAIYGVTVPPGGGAVALGDIPTFRWFGYSDHYIYYDRNGNGFRDCLDGMGMPSGNPDDCDNAALDDISLPEQNINLRFRDGSIYQALINDFSGNSPLEEVFPFFKYLIAEVDYARFKATGVTIITDGGGPVPADLGWDMPSRDRLTPQEQCASVDSLLACIGPIINPNTGNNLSRTITGPVLTLATQTLPNLTNVFEWGKALYGPGENGGISGIIYYATTRAEDDPRFAAGEPWEPGIPRVQVNLYVDGDVDRVPRGWATGGPMGAEDIDWDGDGVHDPADGAIDDVNGVAGIQLADVDNYPFGDFPGPGDVNNGAGGAFDAGDAVQVTSSDSWDDNLPTGCNAPAFMINGGTAHECFEGLRNFNQVRDGVFDGGYAFFTGVPGGATSANPAIDLPEGAYIVEAALPPGYEHLKEEHKNVDFGDEYEPTPLLLPPVCVGDDHLVPAELVHQPGIEAPYAGQLRPVCDRKLFNLAAGQNAAADFYMLTEVPKSARIVGFVLNDLVNEFDPNSPSYGEKVGAPWLPLSIKDYEDREVLRIYTDQFGSYNALVPSTHTVSVPSPTGVSPAMYQVCLNDPGPIQSPGDEGVLITDPRHDPALAVLCYNFDAWPGKTTYLDTPILPRAAASGRTNYPLDCELADGTPVIHEVNGPLGGPYVAATGLTLSIEAATILGPVTVANPAYAAGNGQPLTTVRDYGFGSIPGTVSIGGVTIPAINVNWGTNTLSVTVPAGVTGGQLLVTRGDNGQSTTTGITVTVGGPTPVFVPVGGSIQAAIDAAAPGALILVPPGLPQPDGSPAPYEEYVVMWKPVRLQGYSANSTKINVTNLTSTDLDAWHAKIDALVAAGSVDLLPGQTAITSIDHGAGIMVLARDGDWGPGVAARIDGFSISGSVVGSGINVNGYARYLEIANNNISLNNGVFGGGIRLGHPFVDDGAGNLIYQSAFNEDVLIHHNQVNANGTRNAAGGGIALFHGSTRYQVTNNHICGNFTSADGAGIGHLGLSDDGIIANNTILFNHAYQQTAGFGGGGAGIYVGGGVGLTPSTLGPGAGDVSIVSNLIQGNQAATDDGAGILAQYVNGDEVGVLPANYALDIYNNIIVNNVTGLAGAITLQDTINADIRNNTVARNDSIAISAAAFTGNINGSTKQPAGIVSRAHTPNLAGIVGAGFSDPLLENNIIWQNRSFHWDVSLNGGQGGLLPDIGAGDPPVYDDLAVLGTTGDLNPVFCLLTDPAYPGGSSNITGDPMFTASYFNGGPSYLVSADPISSIDTAPAFDEGGNFIDLSMGPLTLHDPVTGLLLGDYHIPVGSPAEDAGTTVAGTALLVSDFDGDNRPSGVQADIGADEIEIGGVGPLVLTDSDADGVDDNVDNCTQVANIDQRDTDTDGYGNICDPDFDNDGNVNFNDLGTLGAAFFSTMGNANWNADADLDGDGNVNFNDLGIMGVMFFSVPGPSGVVP